MLDNNNDFRKVRTSWNKGKKCPWVSKAQKGKEMSKEIRDKISIILKGHLVSREAREKMSVKAKGRKFSFKHKENISKSLKALNRGKSYYRKI